jgi:hypothetical protein
MFADPERDAFRELCRELRLRQAPERSNSTSKILRETMIRSERHGVELQNVSRCTELKGAFWA